MARESGGIAKVVGRMDSEAPGCKGGVVVRLARL